jgi:hypothetical protein
MKNLIQAAAVTLFAVSTANAQQAVQWKVGDGGNGHWYAFRSQAQIVCWSDAKNRSVGERPSRNTHLSGGEHMGARPGGVAE